MFKINVIETDNIYDVGRNILIFNTFKPLYILLLQSCLEE